MVFGWALVPGEAVMYSQLSLVELESSNRNESTIAATWPLSTGGGAYGSLEWVSLSVRMLVGVEAGDGGFVGRSLSGGGLSWDGVGEKALRRGPIEGGWKWRGLDVCVWE